MAVPDSATVQEPASTTVPRAAGPVTLADAVRRAAAARPEKPALISVGGAMTWAQLDSAVDAVAQALCAEQLDGSGGHPARVAIALPNSPDFAVAFFAVQRAGLVAVPLNPACTAPELRHVLADSRAALLIATEQVRDLVAGVAGELPELRAVRTSLPEPAGAARPAAPPSDEDLAVLLYTSGTEGRPKGAMISHRALRANHEQIERIEPPVVGSEDIVLLVLPLFHAYGLNAGLGAVAYHGGCGVLVDRFDARATLEAIARHRVTVLVGIPSMFLAWTLLAGPAPVSAGDDRPEGAGGGTPGPDLAGAMASVRVAVSGAAPLEAAVSARFTEATGGRLAVGYGLTETATVVTSTLASARPKAGSIGTAVPGVELRLVSASGEDLWLDGSPDPDDEEDVFDPYTPSPGTDPGEIVVRGANLFSGYWPDGRDGPDADGWWATGDIAYADADGDLFLVDRLGELILVNGFNVYPHEIELVLDAHPEVLESAVLGTPDPVSGQAVKAYVVRTPDSALDAEQLLRHCEGSLARFKCPTTVEFVEALPHSAIGKVRKTMLRPVPGGPDLPKGRSPRD